LKIGLISDVHGNYSALKKVICELKKYKVEQIYCIGDVAGYYPQINECCELLREHNIQSVMGNHDWYLVSGSGCPRSKSANDCIDFQRKIITTDNMSWISNFKTIIKIDKLIMFHGGFQNPIDEYLKPSLDYFENNENQYFVTGHTHKQLLKEYKDKVYCNPGSVGQPRDNDNRAAFAIFDNGIFTLHRVSYDIDATAEAMKKAGFNEYYYKRLNFGSEHFHN
jgi:putative phosphoesterase